MFRNTILSAFRGLTKNLVVFCLNILGLALGMSIALLIFFFVYQQLNYDTFYTNYHRVYRIDTSGKIGESELRSNMSPPPLLQVVQEMPAVETGTRIRYWGNGVTVKTPNSNEQIYEKKYVLVDSTFFKVFNFNILAGRYTALNSPTNVAISRSTAMKLFNTVDCVNEEILVGDRPPLTVGLVYEDIPQNAHFHFNVLLPMAAEASEANWLNSSFHTYVLLRPGANAEAFESSLNEVLPTYVLPALLKHLNLKDADAFKAAGNRVHFSALEAAKLHTHSDVDRREFEPVLSITYLYVLSSIACLLLILAVINYVNLTTAIYSTRTKEIGIRKTIGANASSIFGQFMSESMITAIASVVLAITLVFLLLPSFNSLVGYQVQIPFNTSLLAISLVMCVLVGLTAGFYPSVLLARQLPGKAIAGKNSIGGQRLRGSLVVLQFAISSFLIFASLLILAQMSYVRQNDIGFDRSNILVVNQPYLLGDANKVISFRDQLLDLPQFESVTISGYLPVSADYSYRSGGTFNLKGDDIKSIDLGTWQVDENYFETLQMSVVSGRSFRPNSNVDSASIIVNEETVRQLGLSDPINQTLQWKLPEPWGTLEFTIVGVVKDFNFESFKQKITPIAFMKSYNPGSISLKFKDDVSPEEALEAARAVWNERSADQPFNYGFLDDSFNLMYHAENNLGRALRTLTLISMTVACLGLAGLIIYSVKKRSKEIAVRQIYGSSSFNVISIFVRETVQAALIGYAIAIPLCIYFVNVWLSAFLYKFSAIWIIYTVTLFGIIAVGTLITFVCVVRAANINHIKLLRSE